MSDMPQTAAEYRKQEQDRKRKEAFEKRAAGIAATLTLLPLIAYILMLAVGAVHSFAPAVPAIGYGTTILLVLGLDALATMSKKFRK